jgi:membrane-bound metal-dependent hydrolase YbcI (DUF457 family)
MQGRSHALSGGVAGAAWSTYVLHVPATPHGLATQALLTLVTACAATMPDLDTKHSCASRCLGFLSGAFAWLVSRVSGGHRHGTHSVIGVAAFTWLAAAACHYRYGPYGRVALGVFLALVFAAGLRALCLGGHWADVLAIGVAGGMTWGGYGLALVPLGIGLGCATHLAGDMLTDEGIPVFWPVSAAHFKLLPEPLSFTTGTAPERYVVAPGLLIALGLLAWHAAALPVPHLAAWHG